MLLLAPLHMARVLHTEGIEVFERAENIVEMIESFRSDAAVLLDREYIILCARRQRVGLAGSRCCPSRTCGVRRASSCKS